MYPVLFSVGDLEVGTHAFFSALAFAVGAVVFMAEARRRREWDERLLPVLAGVVVGGAVGARLAGLFDGVDDGLAGAATGWLHGSKSILGGIAGAYIGVHVGRRIGGYPRCTGGLFAPALALALAVGRIGCFLTEAPGRPTNLPWGITVTPEQAATIPLCPGCVAGVPMHPSFLYEIGFLLFAFAALLWLRERVTPPAALFFMFLAAYAVFRFGVEFTRANEILLLGLTGSQVFILAVSPLLAVKLVRAYRLGAFERIWPQPRSRTGGFA